MSTFMPSFPSLCSLLALISLVHTLPGLSEPPHIPSISVLYKLPSNFNLSCGLLPTSNITTQTSSNSSSLFTPILISKESSFAWGFINNEPSQYKPSSCSLSIVCYNCKSFYVAWSACCDVQGEAFSRVRSLKLGKQRELHMVDEHGTLLWSSNSFNVESIELLETGNLLLLDDQNTIVWQSFHYPSDVLLPSQMLTPGMSLIAGDYSASLQPGGLALYVKVSQTLLPYLVLNSSWGLSDVDAVTAPDCTGLSLVYAADGSTLMMEIGKGIGESPCYNASAETTIQRSNLTVSTSLKNTGTRHFRYLKLGHHGGLQTYIDDDVAFSWFNQGDDNEGRGYCNLPSHCGEFGICAPGGQCRCAHNLVNQSIDYLMATDYSVATPEMEDCSQFQGANCSVPNTNYKVLRLQDLEYFPHRYMPPPARNLSMQACVESCTRNCSCVIAFYNNQSLDCHHYSKVLSLQRTTYGGNYLVFIKMVLPEDEREEQLDDLKTTISNHRLSFIAIALIFGVSLIVCLVIFLWVYKHYGSWSDEGNDRARVRRTDDELFLGSLPGLLPPRYTYKEMQQWTNGFSLKLGQGSFGSVYEGALEDGSKIAVKRLEGTRQGDKEFRAEVAALAGISHVNLVRLRGFCAEEGHRMLVYEYMTNGSLDRWLARGQDGGSSIAGLHWRQRLIIATNAARGLAYLHGESRERIFHLDIKPQNILLDEKLGAKLSDFGLSKQMDRARSRTITSMRGTPGYLAPEWLLQSAISDKSDVYSFGMVLLELVSGRRNVDYSSSNPDKWFWPAWVVSKAVSGLWPDIRTELSSMGWPLLILEGEKAIKVALWCLQEDPKSRPTMATVLLMLEGLVHIADPPLEMRLTLAAQARLLASFHPDHCSSSPATSPPSPMLTKCFSNPWSYTNLTSPTSAPPASSIPTSPYVKPSLSI